MKKTAMISFVATLLLLQIVVASDSITVGKRLDKTPPSVGESVIIILNITNPFGKELPVRITDKNIFGNNGVDIQCMEVTLPNQPNMELAYEPIKPYSFGEFTLDPASINYTNPSTGAEEIVESEPLDVTVKESNSTEGEQQGITAIYKCGGMQMQSTSYSKSSKQQSGKQEQQTEKQRQEQQAQASSTQQRAASNQQSQDAGSIKQQMGKQLQEKRTKEEAFRQKVAQNEELRKMHTELLNKGYNMTDASFDVNSSDTGIFRGSYKNAQGEDASISGEMQNGSMNKLMSQTAEDRAAMKKALENNPDYQMMREQLNASGFNQTEIRFDQRNQNLTDIRAQFNHGNQTVNITAQYLNQTITNLTQKGAIGPEENRGWIWLSGVVLLSALAGLWAYLRYLRPEQEGPNKKHPKPVDHRKEAKILISLAEKQHASGKEKDAHESVSKAVRIYMGHTIGMTQEMTAHELLKELKKAKRKEHDHVKECLEMCSLVEFAKHNSKKDEFEEMVRRAREIIG